MSNAARRRATSPGATPKKHAPSPSSTAVWSMSSAAIPASTCQYGTAQRFSSRSAQPLSSSA
jgi:hypothetical protein